jgi:uncharacterized membrane protein YbhN (UPF0104 family)
MLAYSMRYAGNVLPIPGGVGALDASLTGGLVLYGVSPAQAAVAVIVYHAIALWVPGFGGLLGYARVRSRLLTGESHLSVVNAFAPDGAKP